MKKERLPNWIEKHKFTLELFKIDSFRTIIFLAIAFAINIAYAVINAVIGIIYLSFWYGVLATYYIILAFMRGIILFYRRKRIVYGSQDVARVALNDIKKYRNCGILLILLPLCLSFVILGAILSNNTFSHPGFMIYAEATYTAYKVTMAIYNFVKTRKLDDMILKAVRNINLSDALVSILALQMAMLREFSPDMSVNFVNCLTGGAVCALTISLGIYMVVYGNYKYNTLNSRMISNKVTKESGE